MDALVVLAAFVSALIAIGAMTVAIWQASEAEKSRAATEKQADIAEKAYALAKEQYANLQQQQAQELDRRTHDAVVHVGMQMLEHGTLIRQAANMLRNKANPTRAAENIALVWKSYVSNIQAVVTIPPNERYNDAIISVVEETKAVQDGIRRFRPVQGDINIDKLDELADSLHSGYSRIVKEALKAAAKSVSDHESADSE